ncbi:MAG: hypothetical protein R2729_25095 [Bryobacteraceae bacterium]
MPKPPLEVSCPCCEALLKVDPATGAVLTYKEKERPRPIEDLKTAVNRLKQEEVERNEKFQRSMEAERNKKDILNKRFDELFKQAKEDPDMEPRRKEIDWD